MEDATAAAPRSFEHLREHSIGLPQVLFQSITHMAPAAAVAYSIYISVPDAQQALPLSVALALIACICAATAIGQLAKLFPSAGGMYTYAARSLGPWAGFLVAWLFILFEPLVAPFLYLEFGWAMREVFQQEIGFSYSGQWWIWVLLITVVVFLLTYRDIRISTTAGVILGGFEIVIFGGLAIWMLLSNTGDLNAQPLTPATRPASGAACQGHGVCDPGLYRLRGGRAAWRGGKTPAAHGPARGSRVGDRDRPVLRAVRVCVGVRRGFRSLRRAGHRRRSLARPGQGVLEHRLDPRVPGDL